MTSSPVRGKDTSSLSLSSRSLLSRLRLPLQSKTRNFTDFYIQPDDPHRQYAPGDIISGSVIVKVVKPLRITHLVVTLHGYAQVFKNPNSPGDAYKNYSTTVGSGKGRKSGGYFGNGFVSLFEDEAVLCGEGRLGEGAYHFNFELEFPSKDLPSSIDFERGTIAYMLTATLTRPTTISPTASCDTKVYLSDVIDVASLAEPKPRIISLEPISRRARTKAPRKRPQTQESEPQPDSSETARKGRAPELSSVVEEGTVPESPAPSDVSFGSRVSSGNASGTEYGVRSVHTALDAASANGSQPTIKGKTITATIELGKGGFLRGDSIPLRIRVDHTKHVRSLKGIIITLYRQARVDMHPALPIAPNSRGDKTKSEDYYPKSRTGLGGLSLSSAGSSHLFRKDLSQSFAPLFVDPRTLTADVKCAVRVPDEAFPSISNVPGAMISFKYFVEVVVDIQGKLSGLDRMLPNTNAGVVSLPSGTSSGAARADDPTGSMFSTWGGNFADTDAIRREKGVISCLFEVIIGTKDSERNGKKKQQPQEPNPTFDQQGNVHEFPPGENRDFFGTGEQDGEYYDYDYRYDQNGQHYDGYGYDNLYWDAPGYQATEGTASHPPYSPPPPPPPNNEEGLSEKERLRRAEARLLPSEPPGETESSSPSAPTQAIPPSAPVLPDDDYPNPPYFTAESSTSASSPPPPFVSSALSTSRAPPAPSIQRGMTQDDARPATVGSSLTINANPQDPPPRPTSHDPHGTKPLPSLPPLTPAPASAAAPHYSPASSSHVQPTDDKQELQRRRLELETSAPPLDEVEPGSTTAAASSSEGASATSPPPPPASALQSVNLGLGLGLAPSAPMLDDDDEGLVDAVRPGRGARQQQRGGSEALPEYQR
ncbi:hypothetical protein CC80DRAFT_426211 [Byssothecium circinans]|uniref:Arrestin C-terminal-like domain-containing protein n=1 Tax=Byssothecium circinans TaxID=147558 RepID=A0A6A5TD78_9PLEO|nr:hypothetical protein CC80DRAFT_426211 [Byssothecium circinans]